MKIVRDYEEVIKLGEESTIVVWGGGNLGTNLVCQFELAGFTDYYISDTNPEVREYIKNYISPKNILNLARQHHVTIIIAVKSDAVINEIIDNINKIVYSEEMGDFFETYRYVPESREELIKKREEAGVFDGITYRKALNDDVAIQVLRDMITGTEAFLFARWGTIEGDIVYKIKAGIKPSLKELATLKQNAGVFPTTEKVIASYCNIMENAARTIDMLCIFYWQVHLDKWVEWFSPKAVLVSSALEYPFFSNPWTEALRGMKVLVIHPYSKLIAEQYKKRDRLFANLNVLPEFELITYQAVQSMGGNEAYENWIEALERMQSDVSKMDFDIALIGCGAYGMPLGAFIKSRLHKKAIHMGGTLQILFGIKGKRWESESYDYQHKLYNEYWVRPTDDLKPQNYMNVENGCYW